MVRKEDLYDWFKALPAHKRVDYMCGLLRLCLPLELRFIGTVLEDLAKKDFHVLRDQEIKANQRSDLSSNNSSSLSDKKLRAKILTALALMSSNNSPCADILFEILQNEFNNILGLLHDPSSTADISMILTMAVRHPAFSFYQRNQLGQALERVEAHIHELCGDDIDNDSSLIVHSQTLEAQHCSFRPDTRQEASQYHPAVLIPPYPSVISYAHCSSEQPEMSSAASSPVSSRTSSPSPLTLHGEGKSHSMTSGAAKANHLALSSFGLLQPVHIADQTFQLLHLLNLEEYYDNLKDYPLYQILQMSKEDFAKAGLPAEAQTKLQSCLSQVKTTDINGVVDSNRQPLAEAYYAPPYHYSYAHISHPYLQQLINPAVYSAQPGQITLLASPHPHDSSSTSSDTSSRSTSPLVQSVAGLSLDPVPSHVVGQLPPVAQHQLILPVMGPHPGSQAFTNVKASHNQATEHADSSGSDEDESQGLYQKPATSKTKGDSKLQQSQSAPLVSRGSNFHSALEASKLTDVLISMTTPHDYPKVLTTAELRSQRPSTPPSFPASTNQVLAASPLISAPVANEPQPDPCLTPVTESSITDPRIIQQTATTQSALGLPNNTVTPPAPELQHPSLENSASSSISLPVIHGIPLPSYIPIASSISSTHLIGLNPGNYHAQNPSQFSPHHSPQLLLKETGRAYPRYFISQPRGIPTTVANSSSVTITTQSLQSRPHTSHTLPPVSPHVAESVDPIPEESVQTVGALKSPSHSGGGHSHRSSPPFTSAPPQKQVTTETLAGGRGPRVVGFINGFVPQIIHHPSHQPQKQSTPNGVTSDYEAWLRLPIHIGPNYFPQMYRSANPQTSLHGSVQTTASPSTTASTPSQSHSSGGTSTKSKCYNCGHGGHHVSDCQESRMETMSNAFHLRYNPSEPPV